MELRAGATGAGKIGKRLAVLRQRKHLDPWCRLLASRQGIPQPSLATGQWAFLN